MQNCLNFSVDRSMKAKRSTATQTYPGPPFEGENRPPARRHCPKFRQQMDSRLRGNDNPGVSTRIVSPGPLRGAEQRRGAGGFRLALSEPQASLASRPALRVAQGTGAAGTDPGSPFLWLLSFGEAKESTPAPQARKTRLNEATKASISNPASMDSRLRGNTVATVPPRTVSPAPLRGAPQ